MVKKSLVGFEFDKKDFLKILNEGSNFFVRLLSLNSYRAFFPRISAVFLLYFCSFFLDLLGKDRLKKEKELKPPLRGEF